MSVPEGVQDELLAAELLDEFMTAGRSNTAWIRTQIRSEYIAGPRWTEKAALIVPSPWDIRTASTPNLPLGCGIVHLKSKA